MRTIREVLRLKLDFGLSDRQIAQTAGIARSTVGEYLRRFRESGLVRARVGGVIGTGSGSLLVPAAA